MSAASDDSGPEAAYRRFLKNGQYRVQRCRDCSRALSYPRAICPLCGSARLDFVEADGRGVVYSTTVVRRPAETGGDYNVALIELVEGTRTLSRVEGVAPHRVEIGMPVVAVIRSTDPEPLVVFEPASDTGK